RSTPIPPVALPFGAIARGRLPTARVARRKRPCSARGSRPFNAPWIYIRTAVKQPLISLSSYVLPQARMGNMPLFPQNLCDGRERLAYLRGALAFLQNSARGGLDPQAIAELRRRIPFGELLVDGDANHRVFRPRPDAEDLLHFNPERLG